MIKNYLKIAIRNLLRYKTYTLINIFGLAVGLACAIVIMIWIQEELSVDRFHTKINEIYQVNLKWIQNGIIGYQSTVSPATAGVIKNEYPEVSHVARVYNLDEVVLKTDDKMILESNGIGADPSLFKIFTYPLLQGNPDVVLAPPHSIVLSESMARKYFGFQEAVGRSVRMNNKVDLLVTGVMKDIPRNTSQKFDFIVPFTFLKELGHDIDGTPFYPCMYSTFVTLRDNVSYQALSEKIEKRIFENEKMISFSICLLPFQGAYLRETEGMQKIIILSLIALFILVIACINFTNLATARSSIRRKEIGIRKVAGAGKFQMLLQFLIESLLLVVFALAVALMVATQILHVLNQFAGKSLTIPYSNPVFILGLMGLVVVTSFCAGIYPALYLSEFKPVEIFKRQTLKSGKSMLRKALIVFQFSLSISFIISTFIISHQINFIHNFNLGINQYNIVYVSLDGEIRKKYDLVKSELLRNPNIVSVTSASLLPIAVTSDDYMNWGKNDNIARKIFPIDVSYDFPQTFGLQMADGRFYSNEYPSDSSGSIIVNESAIRTVGLESPIGKPFFFDGTYYNLIGTIKDFHFNKLLHSQPEPLVMKLILGGGKYLFAKLNPNISNIGKTAEVRQFIQSVCNTYSTEWPLQCKFLSDFSFDEERTTEAMKDIVLYSTVLAVFISCLGLFGLSMFISQQRTKEIGIRKTLGASVPNAIGMLTREFVKWVLAANLFAWPLSYFILDKWLQNFAYRVDLTIWPFLLAGVLAWIIALLTVSWQAIRAATVNPVEALRYE
jgi:putative ABC transport system permease protein